MLYIFLLICGCVYDELGCKVRWKGEVFGFIGGVVGNVGGVGMGCGGE